MTTLLTASLFFCAISWLFIISQNMFKRRNRQVDQLMQFIKQGQQLKNSAFSDEQYQQWVNTVNDYLNAHLSPSLSVRFNQVRAMRSVEQNSQDEIFYKLDGRLFRLTEFVIELKRIRFYEPEALGRYFA